DRGGGASAAGLAWFRSRRADSCRPLPRSGGGGSKRVRSRGWLSCRRLACRSVPICGLAAGTGLPRAVDLGEQGALQDGLGHERKLLVGFRGHGAALEAV
ncbi:hypothetical protein, partial [Cyanobium sp. LEGE 06143]|uniref:hypothetical protein n=1 Tax=Cyanobium sp. LEGE 06143 TaxID=945727 RepID=UPI001D156E50